MTKATFPARKPKVVIFGLGTCMNHTLPLIQHLVEIVAFSSNDEKQWGEVENAASTVAPEKIKSLIFDYVLVMSSFYADIKKQLINSGIDAAKIIYFSNHSINAYARLKQFKKIEAENVCYDGLVLGMSYAFSFLPSESKYSMLSLANAGQDIYHDYLLCKKFKHKMPAKKRSILWFIPYSIFNYDVLKRSGVCFNSILYDNLFDHNISADLYSREDQPVTFLSWLEEHGDFHAKYYRMPVNFDEEAKIKAGRWSEKFYQDTVVKNKALLEAWLNEMKADGIDFHMVVPPFSSSYRNYFPHDKIDEFKSILADLLKKYDFSLHDFYNDPLFDDSDFADADHLNMQGKIKLTRLLEKQLSR